MAKPGTPPDEAAPVTGPDAPGHRTAVATPATAPRGRRVRRRARLDPVAPAEPRPSVIRRFPFSRRVAFLTAGTVVLTAVLTATALAAIAPSRTATAELADRIIPVVDTLYQASESSQRGQEAFEAALVASGAERALLVAESQRFGNRAASAWSRYRDLALGSPPERALMEQYERLTAGSQAAGADAFALADSPDLAARQAAFEAQSSTADAAYQTILEIRRRFYVERMIDDVLTIDDDLRSARVWIVGIAGAISLAVIVGGVLLYRVARRDERVLDLHEAARRQEERRANLENQLQRGLEMEPTEESTFEVIRSALTMVRPDEPVELLLADSSRAHFHQAFSTDEATHGPGCAVPSPADCPAAGSGQTRLFLSSERLDACPHLRHRTPEGVSATCVPVNVAGATTGVLHTTGPDLTTPDANALAELELIARKAGERIGYLRVLARSEMQARVDPLTGLLNRRSLDDAARELVERGDPFVVAFADLDHFKDLNDTYGHETGDRALRLFGRVLRDSVRPADVPARYGGEEFVVLLPDTVLPDARIVAERIRDRLRTAVATATVPTFTVSLGLAVWEPPEDFADTVARADGAMLHAKGEGRDRVVTSSEVPADATGDLGATHPDGAGAGARPATTPTT